MKQCMDLDNLHRRINKIIGQLNAIDRMIEEDIPCENICRAAGRRLLRSGNPGRSGLPWWSTAAAARPFPAARSRNPPMKCGE